MEHHWQQFTVVLTTYTHNHPWTEEEIHGYLSGLIGADWLMIKDVKEDENK